MSILTNIKKIVNRQDIIRDEKLSQEDLLKQNKDNIIADVSQRRGLVTCSGLTISERDYILSDSMITSALQLYLADILDICSRDKGRIVSDVKADDENGENAERTERANYIYNQIFSDSLIEAIGINLLTNGEIFLNTEYQKVTNSYSVVESPFTRCTQLLFNNGEVAGYVASNVSYDENYYNACNYNLNNNDYEIIDAYKMVRVYSPTLVNSKICIELSDEDNNLKSLSSDGKYLYYTNSQSLLKQIYPDWLNGKLLELAVYRDRIAKSRNINLIAIELGRTSRETSDQIYDSIKDYFDKRAVIDLEKQTFKSVVGDEPFTEYKVYTTRNGVGQITFDNSLNGNDLNVSSLADLDYNLNKIYAGLGIPKQYLSGDDDGSALSNGSSLFFISEKYQKRVIAYVKRIAKGLKDCIKNILYQQNGKEYFSNWDFDVVFEIPENNEDIYRVKNARIEYVNAVLDLVDRIDEAKANGKEYSVTEVNNLLQDDINKVIDFNKQQNKEGE